MESISWGGQNISVLEDNGHQRDLCGRVESYWLAGTGFVAMDYVASFAL